MHFKEQFVDEGQDARLHNQSAKPFTFLFRKFRQYALSSLAMCFFLYKFPLTNK